MVLSFIRSPPLSEGMGNAQVIVHLVERAVGLLEEVEDDALAELSLLLVIVHLEDLLKGCDIDSVAKIGESAGTLLALLCCVSSRWRSTICMAGTYSSISCRHICVF